MANLRVDKITSTETFETTGSVQFDGDGDYLRLDDHADLEFGSGDFTVECFIYPTGVPQGTWACIFSKGFPLQSYFMNTNSISLYASTTASGSYDIIENANITGTNSVPRNRWTHYAVCRSGDIWKVFIDGIEKYSALHPGTIADSIQPFGIGDYSQTPGTYEFQGHISNFRVLKGKALYTENFKVPMRELEVIPETVLLACQSKTDASHEKTGRAIEVNGNAVANELTPGLITDIVKSGGSSAITGSVEFDGEYDGLVLSKSTDFQFGTGDFTIEGWFNVSDTGAIRTLFDSRNTDNNSTGIFVGINSDDNLYTYGFPSGTGVTNYGVPKHGEWHHFAVVRNGSNGYVFLNGVKVSGSIDTSSSNYTDQGATVGQPSTAFAETLYRYKGFISNFRVVKGTALYTDNFIPPTRELKKVPGTVLLCCQDPDNPLTEATGKTITGYGSLQQDSPELVTDGEFESASNWSSAASDWTVGSGQAVINSSDSGYDLLGTLATGLLNGEQYEFVFSVTNYSTGRLELAQTGSGNMGVESPNGRNVFRFTYTGTTGGSLALYSYTANTASFTLTNVSLKRVFASRSGSNFTPQVGDDRKVTFEGVTKINTENYFYLPTGDTVTRDSRSGTRGVFTTGYQAPAVPSQTNVIDYINISSTGNAKDFGDTTNSRWGVGSCSSSTRGLIGGGYTPVNLNVIDHITIASTGNGQDFGDLTNPRRALGSCSSSTRGIFAGGYLTSPTVLYNIIDYVTIASKGDAKDFGDTTFGGAYKSSFSSPTRGVIAGNYLYGETPNINDVIDYITIASTGDAQDFGDLTQSKSAMGGASNNVRGLFGGGFLVPTRVSDVDYITIASKGDAQDFGDLLDVTMSSGGTSSQTRGIFGGGSPTVNTIQYVTIMSTGNATDFGDLSVARGYVGAFSNGHGGLG